MDFFRHATGHELAWFFLGLVAMIVHIVMILSSSWYLKWIRDSKLNGSRRTGARWVFAQQAILTLGQFIFAFAGLIYCLTPAGQQPIILGHEVRSAGILALIFGQLCFMITSVVMLHTRYAIVSKSERDDSVPRRERSSYLEALFPRA